MAAPKFWRSCSSLALCWALDARRAGREPGKLVRNMKAYFNLLNIELKSELDILDQIKEVKEEIEKPIREINRMK